MRRRLGLVDLVFAACLLTAVMFGSRPARADLIGITRDNQLMRIDTLTGQGTLLGTVPGPSMTAFGLGVRGSALYAFDQIADRIVQLDPADGSILDSIDIGIGDISGEGGLDFRSDGIGFLSSSLGSTGRLYEFDVAARTSTPITAPGGLAPSMDGLAFDSNQILYGLKQESGCCGELYTIDQGTGATTSIGGLGYLPTDVAGLAFDVDGTLYAAIGYGTSFLYRIDKATGAPTFVGDIGFSSVSGLAPMPIPEPSTLILLGLGLAGVGALRHRLPIRSAQSRAN